MNDYSRSSDVAWPTIGLFCVCIGLWVGALMLPIWLGVWLLVFSLVLHSSLSHEILHGHPFAKRQYNDALGLIQPGLLVPYWRFKRLHLEHHRDSRLTDPYDDPETNYLDPKKWDQLSGFMKTCLSFNNTLLGRMLIGPLIGTVAFVRSDLARIFSGERRVLYDWLWHLPSVGLVAAALMLSEMPFWVYFSACYGALSVLKIRTFCEHRAHEDSAARTVIIEDRGILSFLFLNNNFHVVHHQHPKAPWYRLPAIYQAGKANFIERNEGYVFPSYRDVFRAYFMKSKDPVAHPLWRR